MLRKVGVYCSGPGGWRRDLSSLCDRGSTRKQFNPVVDGEIGAGIMSKPGEVAVVTIEMYL